MKKIFLHFGPAANPSPDIEELQREDIYFWKQPLLEEGQVSYIPDLIIQAQCEISRLYKESNQKIHIIAHSFGAFLAINFDSQTKSLIKKYTFLAPTFNFVSAIVNLATFVSSTNSDLDLKSHIKHLSKVHTSENFWKMFQAMAISHPDYLKYYWHKEENYHRYLKIAEKYPGLHEKTLITAVDELITKYNKPLKEYPQLSGEVELYIGKRDPLISRETKESIVSFFDKAKIIELEGGHFPHFETTLTFE